MEVVSLCPLRVASIPWQPGPGAWALTVVCKATFALDPGESRLASEQEYPNEYENHWDDDPARSLYSPSDLVPFKPRADVILVGHAFAPHHEQVRSLLARLSASGIDKSIEVHGERTWAPDGSLREGPRFAKVPLRYERAAGGPETENPVGMRAAALGAPIPNLQPPGTELRYPGDSFPPVGFGPIASSWPARADKIGSRRLSYDGPLPEDLDASFFNVAPADQQVDHIDESGPIVLENLSARHPRLVTKLPGLAPRAFASRPGEPLQEIGLRCDTLWIDTDRSICTLTWRGQLALQHPDEAGRVVVLTEEPGRSLTWEEIEVRADEPAAAASSPDLRVEEQGTVDTDEDLDGSTVQLTREQAERRSRRRHRADPDLPFIKGPTPAASPRVEPKRANVALPFVARPADAHRPETLPGTDSLPLFHKDQAIPFVRAGEPPRPPPPVAPVWTPPVAEIPPVAPPAASPLPALPPLVGMGVPVVAGAAATPSVLAISNAAARAPWKPELPENARAVVPAPTPSRPAAAPEIVELLWFDAAALPRVRTEAAWKSLIAALQPRPPEVAYDDEDPPPEETQDVKDRRDAFGVLTEAEAIRAEALDELLEGAVGAKGAFTPPLLVASGELQFPFDEVETLKSTVTTVTPLAAGDKKLKEAIEAALELLKAPSLLGSSGVADGLSSRIKEAFAQHAKMLPPSYLDTQNERSLLEQRAYQRRTVFGETWIRALLSPAGSSPPIPTYLPDALAKKLPLYQRLRVRLIAELHLQQDQYESHPHAFRAVALGRVTTLSRGRR